MSLTRIIGPMSKDAFIADHWETKSLIATGDVDRFADLFASRDLGRLLHYFKPSPPEGMMLVKGNAHYGKRWTNPDGSPQLKAVKQAMAEGYSAVINGVDKLWEPIERFANALQAELHHEVDINLYVTPAGTQAFAYHWDVMDVFILQIEGQKHWQVFGPGADRPYSDEHRPVDPDALPDMVFEEQLQAGSAIYIPRGHVHAARTQDKLSVHLSVGVQPKTWVDLFASAVQAARNDGRFRSALPPGYLNNPTIGAQFAELAAALPELLNADYALGQLAQDLFVDRPTPIEDDFLAEPVALSPKTVVQIRAQMMARALEGPGYAGIQYSGGKIMGPAKIGPAIRAMIEQRRFQLDSLEAGLSDAEVLVLAKRFVADGLLEVVADG